MIQGAEPPQSGLRDASAGMKVLVQDPENIESDFSSLSSFLTPNDNFYVRNHFSVPALDSQSWQITFEGAVGSSFTLSYDDLLKLPAETKAVTLECAGNGRAFVTPKVDGVPWQLGAVGTAEWTGVPLTALLERANVDARAVDVVFEGADAGEPTKQSRPAKPLHYASSIPLEQARAGGVLLAYKMNGRPLAPAHGFPVRAIVPGWYGMASVKWLKRIIVTERAFQGFFQTVDYGYWNHRDGLPTRVPVTELQVKAQIARPAAGEVVARGGTYRVFGAAWSGRSAVSKVEVSADGGRTFAAAQFLGEPVAHAWRLWEFRWTAPAAAGKYALMAKATDAEGRTQPLERDRDRENYMINHLLPIEVDVE